MACLFTTTELYRNRSPAPCITEARCFCARMVCWKVSHQQLDRCMAATVWAARHHSNSPMHHLLSPLGAWKPHQCTTAWRHRLKPKHRNMFIKRTILLQQKFMPQQCIEFARVVESLIARINCCSSIANRITNYYIQTPLAQAWDWLGRQLYCFSKYYALCTGLDPYQPFSVD